MNDTLYSLLLLAGLAVWYMRHARTAEPKVTICQRCGDLVQRPPMWLTRCPSCNTFIL